jgi:hypothetical protein
LPAAHRNADGQTRRQRQYDRDSFAHCNPSGSAIIFDLRNKLLTNRPAEMNAVADFAIKRITCSAIQSLLLRRPAGSFDKSKVLRIGF